MIGYFVAASLGALVGALILAICVISNKPGRT